MKLLQHLSAEHIHGSMGCHASGQPLHTGGLFQCYMLDMSIYYFMEVGSILFLLFSFFRQILYTNAVYPDQMPLYVASDLGLHCLPMTFLWVSRYEWVKKVTSLR